MQGALHGMAVVGELVGKTSSPCTVHHHDPPRSWMSGKKRKRCRRRTRSRRRIRDAVKGRIFEVARFRDRVPALEDKKASVRVTRHTPSARPSVDAHRRW